MLDTVIAYLDKHPSEAVIVTLKIDSGNQDTGRQALINILNQYTTRRPDRFYCWTGDAFENTLVAAQSRLTSPTLGQARGKIVLMTRVDMSGAGESSLYSSTRGRISRNGTTATRTGTTTPRGSNPKAMSRSIFRKYWGTLA